MGRVMTGREYLINMLKKEIAALEAKIKKLSERLSYDYLKELEEIQLRVLELVKTPSPLSKEEFNEFNVLRYRLIEIRKSMKKKSKYYISWLNEKYELTYIKDYLNQELFLKQGLNNAK